MRLTLPPLALGCAIAVLSLCADVAAASASASAGAEEPPAAPAGDRWSTPAILSACPGTGAPHVVFPSDSPTHGTGPGAIVWSVAAPCPDSTPASAGGAGVLLAPISAEDIPGRPGAPRTAAGGTIALRGPVAATGGPSGRVVIASASATGDRTSGSRVNGAGRSTPVRGHGVSTGGLLLTEGRAGGAFAAPLALGGSTSTFAFAFATGYLGDTALASLADSAGQPTVQLRVQRFYASAFAPPTQVSDAPASRAVAGARAGTKSEAGGVTGLTVALDFRSDRLVVFSRQGSLFARELPGKGAPRALQRLGPSPPAEARAAAVISDDNRAIVAWTVRRDGQTSVYLARSGSGVSFTHPQLLESFPDPPGLPGYLDSPRIVRLSSESVMLAWTGAVTGHWAVRAAAIDLNGVLPSSTISPPGHDALLAGLTPGPDDEALALWSEPQPTAAGLDLGSQAIYAARGFDGYPEQVKFGRPEMIASPGPNSDATVTFDPNSDRAVAAWRTGAGALAYAIRSPGVP